MSLILDGLMVLTVVYFVAASYRIGVVKSVLSVGSLAASYMIAAASSSTVAGLIEKTHIVNVFTENMNAALIAGDETLPGMAGAGEKFVDEFTAMTGTGELLDTSLEVIDMLYSRQVTSVLGFIIVFFLATTAIRIAINILNVAAMLPVIGSVNRFFGLIFGLVEGVIMCCAVCIVVSLLAAAFNNPFGILDAIPQTTVFRVFYILSKV